MRYLFLLLLPSLSFGQVIKQNGGIPSNATVTNLTFNTNGGIVAGTSSSTMTPIGTLYFASTQSVTGSTCTVGGNTAVSFSTYTLAANVLQVGDTLVLECGYINSVTAPTSPLLRPRMNSGGPNNGDFAYYSANVATARQHTATFTRLRIKASGQAEYSSNAISDVFNGNASAPLATDNATTGSPDNLAYDITAAHTLNCMASDNGGGPVNFSYMKVRKE